MFLIMKTDRPFDRRFAFFWKSGTEALRSTADADDTQCQNAIRKLYAAAN